MTYLQCFPGLNERNLVMKCPIKCIFDSPYPGSSLKHDQRGVGTTKLILTRQYINSDPTWCTGFNSPACADYWCDNSMDFFP